jgi:hypothetical protein
MDCVRTLERLNVSPLIKGGAGGIQNLCGGVDARFHKSGEGDHGSPRGGL